MAEFIFKGRLVLDNVSFFIEADTEAEAIAQAIAGKWDNWETHASEGVDWKINPSTLERNE